MFIWSIAYDGVVAHPCQQIQNYEDVIMVKLSILLTHKTVDFEYFLSTFFAFNKRDRSHGKT